MKPKLHFLCQFMKRTDSSGRTYYSATLGNSRLLLFPTGDEMRLYLGEQIEPENKSLYNDRRGTNGNRIDLEAVGK